MASKGAHGADDLAHGFAQRLREALALRGRKPSPTALEREFNLRYLGQPITVHAARKWLLGLALPTQDKLQVLARWLDVSEDWLRWGHEPEGQRMSRPLHTGTGAAPPTAQHARAPYVQEEETSLLQDWRLLEMRNRALVRSIMEVLLRDQQRHLAAPAAAVPAEPRERKSRGGR